MPQTHLNQCLFGLCETIFFSIPFSLVQSVAFFIITPCFHHVAYNNESQKYECTVLSLSPANIHFKCKNFRIDWMACIFVKSPIQSKRAHEIDARRTRLRERERGRERVKGFIKQASKKDELTKECQLQLCHDTHPNPYRSV